MLRGPENRKLCRRRVRDAEGVEGECNGEGVSPSQPTSGSEGASLAPPAGSGRSPGRKPILVHFELAKTNLVTMNVIFFVIFISHIYSHIYKVNCTRYAL